MTAYNVAKLTNLYIHHQIEEAVEENYLNKQDAETIKQQKPVDVYMPNFFVKIGLGFLTLLIIMATAGLMILFLNINVSSIFFQLFFGILCYVALEIITSKKRHYNSGVDTILMAASVVCITTGILQIQPSMHADILMSFIVFILSMWLSFRFVDRLAAIACFAALLTMVYNGYVAIGKSSLLFLPFTLIIVCGVMYFLFKKKYEQTSLFYYKPLLQTMYVFSLLGFYLSGNIFIVNKFSEGIQIPIVLSIFFWSWTMLLPIFFLWRSIKTREAIFIRIGILFIAVSFLTYRYYFPILPPELAMLVAGTILILLSYFFMKHLKQQRHGFIFDNNRKSNPYENIEGLIIGQAFGHHFHNSKTNTEFGGGKFGGGGAGSNF